MRVMHRISAIVLSVMVAVCCGVQGTRSDIEDLDSDVLVFDPQPLHSISFSVSPGTPWTIDTDGSDWMVVSPLSGDGRSASTVYVAVEDNYENIVRSGYFIISTDGELRSVAVIQRPAFADDKVAFSGIPDSGLIFDAVPDSSSSFLVYSEYDWKLQGDSSEWDFMSPKEGKAYKVTEVSLRPSKNYGDSRELSLGIVPEHSDAVMIPAVQRPRLVEPALIAWWSIGDNDFMHDWNDSHDNCWLGHGYTPADKPEATKAEMKWVNIGVKNPTYIISADGNGHWAVKPVWDSDYLEFDVPVSGIDKRYLIDGCLPQGTCVNIKFAMSGLDVMAKNWLVEYYDGGRWIAHSTSTFKAPDGTSVTATYQLPGAKKVKELDLDFVFRNQVKEAVRLRFRPVKCCYTNSGSIVSGPSGGNALRIRPGSSFGDANNAISIYLKE